MSEIKRLDLLLKDYSRLAKKLNTVEVCFSKEKMVEEIGKQTWEKMNVFCSKKSKLNFKEYCDEKGLCTYKKCPIK